MPALIEDDMLAYKGEKPWHNLGFDVPADATGEQMLKLAKMDWEVQRRSLAMRTADGKNTLTSQLKGWKAIVRKDTDYVFQVASDGYFPVQNIEIVNFFKEYCEAGAATMETVGALKGGAIVWALAKLNHDTSMLIGGVDKIDGYLLMATSHDGSVRTIGKSTIIRVVCANTLFAAFGEKSQQEFKMKHSRKWTPEVAKEAKRVMGMAAEQVVEANQLMATLSKVAIDDKGKLEFVKRLMSKTIEVPVLNPPAVAGEIEESEELKRKGSAILEAINTSPGSDLPTAKNTLYGCIQGVTFFCDWTRGKNQDNRVRSAMFGPEVAWKSRAVEIARDMAGIR